MSALAKTRPSSAGATSAEERVARYDWRGLAEELDSYGCAILGKLLAADECEAIAALYPRLAPIANAWSDRMGETSRYPAEHETFLSLCHQAGQSRPTPLLLQYVPGDFNGLHQDLYGDLAFPLQVAILLSEPGRDFTGGEFTLTEQRPRMQSRVEVAPLRQGDAVAFAVHNRPVKGTKGNYRVNMRHGVSRVRSGKRHTLGIILHDAR